MILHSMYNDPDKIAQTDGRKTCIVDSKNSYGILETHLIHKLRTYISM